MKKLIPLLFTGILSLLVSCQKQPMPVQTAAKPPSAKHGEYLVSIIGCNDCHTPKVMTPQGPAPDLTRLLSGHPENEVLSNLNDPKVLENYALFSHGLTAAIGPWGSSFASNLTPHATGLGNWTFENFERAMREGKFKGLENGRPILPPMPWQNFQNISDEDLKDIWAYLQSIPPVKNMVATAIPPNQAKGQG